MKCFLILILAGFMAFNVTNAQKKTTGEEDAVRKVIELETKYYFDGNYDKWASTWSHNPTDYIIYTSPTSTYELIGWDKINADFKPALKNVPLISPEEYSNYAKYDYTYKISGNLAVVTFREGKGEFQTKILEKKNGEWKVTGMSLIYSTRYKVRSNYNSLQSWIGKWKIVNNSYKSVPADSLYSVKSYTVDIHEAMYGIDMITNSSYSYNGRFYTDPAITEQFIPDYNNNVIKYFDFQKSSNGNISTATGIVYFDTSGSVTVKAMYADKPTAVQFENIYTSKDNGSLNMVGKSYDKAGKVTYTWSFDLIRNSIEADRL